MKGVKFNDTLKLTKKIKNYLISRILTHICNRLFGIIIIGLVIEILIPERKMT